MDAQWLQTQFSLNPDKSKAGLAEAMGLEPPAISKILKGTRQIKAQEYILMRGYFGLPNDGHAAIASAPAYTLPSNAVPMFADGDTPPGEWMMPEDFASTASPEKMRVFQVRDQFMEPEFKQGERVLVDTADKTPPGVFVLSDGYSTMLRHCEATAKSNPVKIKISARKNFQTQTLQDGEFLILGRVIARLNML
jgi:transcriptional regulator with XRE-family HTH domain